MINSNAYSILTHDKNSTANIIFHGKIQLRQKTNKLINIVLRVLVNQKTQEKDINVLTFQRNK